MGSRRIAIIGGGAAGFFAALAASSRDSSAQIDLIEAARQPLQKVRISGGGRCNVTHHCFDPRELVKGYPRGAKELLGPFTRFGPRETVQWFESRGVRLKVEGDGRMFPVTDRSASVVDCFLTAAREAGFRLRLGLRVAAISARADAPGFDVRFADGSADSYDCLLLATGGNPAGFKLAAALGHEIVPGVPSLFTFNVSDPRLNGLSGISFDDVGLTLAAGQAKPLSQRGPLLVTHWGFSGPAVLKLSAWGARMLADCGYRAILTVNLGPDRSVDDVRRDLLEFKTAHARKLVRSEGPIQMPSRYWGRLVAHAGIADDTAWAQVSARALAALVGELTSASFTISGKGIFKDEFVTCGGVKLNEIDFRTMESRITPGLFLAGEILDIDGSTGGFNFQSAWTTGWIAGTSM